MRRRVPPVIPGALRALNALCYKSSHDCSRSIRQSANRHRLPSALALVFSWLGAGCHLRRLVDTARLLVRFLEVAGHKGQRPEGAG